MNTEGLDALNYFLALVSLEQPVFEVWGEGSDAFWTASQNINSQQSVIPPGVDHDLSMLFVCLPAALHHIFRPSRSALMENV